MWSIPDNVMIGVWNKIVDSGRMEQTFYDGFIKNSDDFLDFMKSSTNILVLTAYDDHVEIVSIGWINGISNGIAYAHFCYLGKYIKEAALMTIDFWKNLDSIKVLIGITPEEYVAVLKVIESWGFKSIGIVPSLCEMAYKGKREGGVISYYLMED
jgi:hypothetical protein